MKQNKLDTFLKILIYIIWVFLLFVGVYDLFIVPYRSLIWFGSLFFLCFFYFKLKQIPKHIYLLLSLIVLLNVFGELFFEFYYTGNCANPPNCTSLFYDKLLHFFNPIVICSFIYFLMKPKIINKKILVLFAVSITLSLGMIWEIIEYGFDRAFGTIMQGVFVTDKTQHLFATGMTIDRMSDTIFDLISNLAGCLVFWVINIFYKNKK